jgi:hypothetical protein
MKRALVLLAIFLTSVVAAARTGQAKLESAPNASQQVLIDAENAFIAAVKKGDINYFNRTLTPDFSFVSYDGELNDRQEMLDELGSGGVNIMPYDMKVFTITDNVAIVTYDVVLTIPPSEDQGPPPRYQHFSTTWVKQGEAWKMRFQQMTVSHFGDW